MKQEFTKAAIDEQISALVKCITCNTNDVAALKKTMQGQGNTPGILEEIRNLKKQVKLYGIIISCLFTGGQFGVFSHVVKALTGG